MRERFKHLNVVSGRLSSTSHTSSVSVVYLRLLCSCLQEKVKLPCPCVLTTAGWTLLNISQTLRNSTQEVEAVCVLLLYHICTCVIFTFTRCMVELYILLYIYAWCTCRRSSAYTSPPLESVSDAGDSVLSIACTRGHVAVIDYLVKNKSCYLGGEATVLCTLEI